MPDIANATLKEPLINSEPFSCAVKMRQIKTPIAGNSQSIAKIGNAAMRRSALAHFNKQMLSHELIRGSLIIAFVQTHEIDSTAQIGEIDMAGTRRVQDGFCVISDSQPRGAQHRQIVSPVADSTTGRKSMPA
jgi:hypothetical protein